MSPNFNDFPPPPPGKIGWPWTIDAATAEALRQARAGITHWPKLSITTPSFNQGHFIEETIRSILLQGYPGIEYFIMDAGSTDNAVEVIKKYEPWLAGWVSEKDKGMADAINKGWSRATGDLVAYLNSDDWYYPGALATMARTFNENPGVSWVGGKVNNGWSPTDIHSRHVPRRTSVAECMGRNNYGYHQPGMFWRRELVQQVGPFNDMRGYSFCHDFWIRSMLLGHQMHCLHQQITFFRLHANSQTVTTKHIFIAGDWAVFDRFKDQLSPDLVKQARKWLREYEADNLVDIIYSFLTRGQQAAAIRYLFARLPLLSKMPNRRSIPGIFFRTLITGRAPIWFRG